MGASVDKTSLPIVETQEHTLPICTPQGHVWIKREAKRHPSPESEPTRTWSGTSQAPQLWEINPGMEATQATEFGRQSNQMMQLITFLHSLPRHKEKNLGTRMFNAPPLGTLPGLFLSYIPESGEAGVPSVLGQIHLRKWAKEQGRCEGLSGTWPIEEEEENGGWEEEGRVSSGRSEPRLLARWGEWKKRTERGSRELQNKGRGPRDGQVGCEREASQRAPVMTRGRAQETGIQAKRRSSRTRTAASSPRTAWDREGFCEN